MTRKRFVKLMMSKGYDRNEANAYAAKARAIGSSYEAYTSTNTPQFNIAADALKNAINAISKFAAAAAAGLSAFNDAFNSKMQE